MSLDIEDVDLRQIVAAADLKVVEIMCRGYLDRARARFRIRMKVTNDRNTATDKRQHDILADQVLVARVFRVHGNGGIAQHRFRARGCNDDIVPGLERGRIALLVPLHRRLIGRAILQRIAQVPQMAFHFDLLDFQVRNCRVQLRIPVDQTLVLVDEALLVERDEDLEHRPR